MADEPLQLHVWKTIIFRISDIIKSRGKDPIVVNIDAHPDPKEQFDMYMATCRKFENKYEYIVTTGLPGEDRIFWPSQDVQFYIHPGGKVNVTGNRAVAKLICG